MKAFWRHLFLNINIRNFKINKTLHFIMCGNFDPTRFIDAYKPNYNLICKDCLILFNCPLYKLIKVSLFSLWNEFGRKHSLNTLSTFIWALKLFVTSFVDEYKEDLILKFAVWRALSSCFKWFYTTNWYIFHYCH